VEEVDWLKDPLMIIGKGSFDYLETNNVDSRTYELWTSFHFNTRLKINGADYFLRQLLGATSRPDQLGVYPSAYYLRQWYLDAFFFELMAAYEVLLQEINVIYKCGVNSEDKRLFQKVKQKLPKDLASLLEEEQAKEWFKKLKWNRNSITHCRRNITQDFTTRWGDDTWRYANYSVSIRCYNEHTNEWDTDWNAPHFNWRAG
jgi:hypothetical protein